MPAARSQTLMPRVAVGEQAPVGEPDGHRDADLHRPRLLAPLARGRARVEGALGAGVEVEDADPAEAVRLSA